MRVEPLGDAAFVLRDLPAPAHAVASAIRELGLAGVVDAAASYDTVGVYLAGPGALAESDLRDAVDRQDPEERLEVRRYVVPVCYELGDDLAEVCAMLGLSGEELIELHCSIEYQCFAVGFCPGFPYLGWLPDRLHGVPRKPSPRVRVPPGSVGLTGRQTGIYPLERPGGWALIGRTPLTLVDVSAGYFPIRAGDTVRFVAITREQFEMRVGERL